MQTHDSIVAECNRAVLTARSGDTRQGLRLAAHAYRRAETEGDPPGILCALNAVAICQSSNGAHINALGTAIDAYRLAVRLGDRRGAAHAMLSLAGASHDVFDSPAPESLLTIHRCIHEALALGDASLQARAQNVLGVALVRSGELEPALGGFERALELLPDRQSVAEGTRVHAQPVARSRHRQ
jgi:tetratricopeptide (TPR) repeat protein